MDVVSQAAHADGLQSWLQLATSTGFVGLAWYLIVIALPRMQDKFDEHSDNQLRRFENQIDKITAQHEVVVKQIIERHERTIQVLTEGRK